MLNRTLRLRGMYRLLLLIPWAVPSFISAFTFRFLFNTPYGFFAQVLQKLGMDQEQVPAFLSDPFWAKVVVITANVWAGIPFMMVALLGGLQAIDQDLIDAAAVDGSNAWQRFWNVTMPGLRPVAATVVLLGLIWTFNMFNYIYLITGGGPGDATQIFSTFAYKYAFEYRLYGAAAAYGVIILSILLVFAAVLPRGDPPHRRGDLVVSSTGDAGRAGVLSPETLAATRRAPRRRRRGKRPWYSSLALHADWSSRP